MILLPSAVRLQPFAFFLAVISGLTILTAAMAKAADTPETAELKIPVTFSAGHEIGKNDFGRPVVLIAAALGVEPKIFRQAFAGVTPARGRGPTGDEARRNKAALMKVLAPQGVTNDRLDEVSDYYRFRPERGELWPTTPAKAYAVVVAMPGGPAKIKRIVVTRPGSGYSSPPEIKVAGFPRLVLKSTLEFSPELKKNGGIAKVEIVEAKQPQAGRKSP